MWERLRETQTVVDRDRDTGGERERLRAKGTDFGLELR